MKGFISIGLYYNTQTYIDIKYKYSNVLITYITQLKIKLRCI